MDIPSFVMPQRPRRKTIKAEVDEYGDALPREASVDDLEDSQQNDESDEDHDKPPPEQPKAGVQRLSLQQAAHKAKEKLLPQSRKMRSNASNFSAEEENAKKHAQDLHNLRHLLREASGGSLMKGWRCVLDPGGDMYVGYQSFCETMAVFHFHGDVSLFPRLHQEEVAMPRKHGSKRSSTAGLASLSGVITFEYVAKKEGKLIERFKRWINEKFGSVRSLFSAMDTHHRGQVSRHEFYALVQSSGFEATAHELHEIFECCDFTEVATVTLEDMIFLELDPATRKREAYNLKLDRLEAWRHEISLEYLKSCRLPRPPGAPVIDEERPVPVTHRRAVRPWQASYYELLPAVACQRRHYRHLNERWIQMAARKKFSHFLKATFGNEIRAFRRALDPNGTFSVSSTTLRNFCSQVNLNISFQHLWKSLDADGDEQVGLEELCVEATQLLAKFQTWAVENFGSCAAFWLCEEARAARALEISTGAWMSDKKMQLRTVVQVLEALGWPGKGIEEEDRAMRRQICYSLDLFGCGLMSQEDLQWLDRWQAPEWLSADKDPEAWEELQELVTRMYGNPLRAWRKVMDRDNAKISWADFKAGCKKVKFNGNIAGVWRCLDPALGGYINIKMFDPAGAELLSSFKAWAESHYGSMAQCFKALDVDKSNQVTYSEMKRACYKMNWDGDVRVLFDVLELDGHRESLTGKRSINLEELGFVESWQVEPSKQEKEREDKALQRELEKTLIGASPRPRSQARRRSATAQTPLERQCYDLEDSFAKDWFATQDDIPIDRREVLAYCRNQTEFSLHEQTSRSPSRPGSRATGQSLRSKSPPARPIGTAGSMNEQATLSPSRPGSSAIKTRALSRPGSSAIGQSLPSHSPPSATFSEQHGSRFHRGSASAPLLSEPSRTSSAPAGVAVSPMPSRQSRFLPRCARKDAPLSIGSAGSGSKHNKSLRAHLLRPSPCRDE